MNQELERITNALGNSVLEIQKVLNTLEGLNIPSTFDNMNRLLGSMQVLAATRDDLGRACDDLRKAADEKAPEEKEKKHGNADAE